MSKTIPSIDAFLQNIFLFPEEASGTLNGNAPDFFFPHGVHLLIIIQQIAAKR